MMDNEDTAAALRDSAEQYRRLIELAPVAITIHHEGVIAFVNPAGVAFMRAASAEQIVGKSIFDILPPSERGPVLERVKAAHATGQAAAAVQTKFLACDGTVLDTEVTAAPVVFEGKPAMMVMVRDLTDLKRAEAEKGKLAQQVLYVQKLESLGVLAGGIAHDFNNLLMAILGNLDLAMEGLPPGSPIRDNLRAAEIASRRAADLARQMLAYSGRGRFVVEPLRLNRIIEEMGHMLEVSLPKKAHLRFDLAPDLPLVEGDAAQLNQVVMNLVMNAAEAIGDAVGAIAVSTRAQRCTREQLAQTWIDDELPEGTYAVLEVEDTGGGMDAQTMARVFDPFFTTKFTGRGLGLAAVLGIVRGHRGAIAVESEPGHGARFRVLLPASKEAPSSTQQPGAIRTACKSGVVVLLADDEEVLRAVGAQMLVRLGYEALIARDGLEALGAVRDLVARGEQGRLVCAILDLKMPRMDGVEAFREIEKILPELPVLLSSGYTEQDAAARFDGPGTAGFIQKPYALKTLAAALEAHARRVSPE
jgi:two-component system, cell cycle sensor histidine kinase and response regulator CckA